MKNIKLALAGAVYFGLISVIFTAMPQAASAALTESQIQAILSLLQSFGADQTVVGNVNSSLRGLPTTGGGGGTAAFCPNFTYNLYLGLNDSDTEGQVSKLQKFLAQDQTVYPEGTITGFYGPLTEQAVKRWQAKNSVVSSGSPDTTGYGVVGSRTRERVRANCGFPTPVPPTPIPPRSSNLSPVISGVSGPTTLNTGQSGTWTVTARDPENGPLSYNVVWGDENVYSVPTLAPSASAPVQQTATFSHTYSSSRVYTPVFYVTDSQGLSAKTSLSVNVGGTVTTQPSITVLSPNGGESWAVGSSHGISWTDSNLGSLGISITLVDSATGGQVFARDLATNIGNNRYYTWTIPNDVPAGSYKINIYTSDCCKPSASDSSDAPFSVTSQAQPLVKITSPVANSTLTSKNITVSGTCSNYFGAVDVFYYSDKKEEVFVQCISGKWSTNISVNSNAGSGSFDLYAQLYPNNTSVQDIIKLYFNWSSAPSITVLSPNGGESWQMQNIHTIRWTPYDPNTGVNSADKVTAYLERLEGGNFVTVGKIVPAGKASIHWAGEIDQFGKYASPGDYYVRTVNNITGASDRSNNSFKLVDFGTIKADLKIGGLDGPITVPLSGGTYQASWTSVNADKCLLINGTLSTSDPEFNIQMPPLGSRSIKLFPGLYGESGREGYVTISCTGSTKVEGETSDQVKILPETSTPFVRVGVPNGKEIIDFSKQYTISWASAGVAYFNIALYKNDAFFNWIAFNIPASPSYYNWTPSNTISQANIGNDVFKIYILGYKKPDGGTVDDKSDAPFSIVSAQNVTATDSDASPNYLTTSPYPVEQRPDLFILGVAKGTYVGGGTCLYGTEPNPTSCKPTTDNFTTYYDHCANESQLNEAYLTGDGKFGAYGVSAPSGYVCKNGILVKTVSTQPSITVVSPNGGESWQQGSLQTIRWSAPSSSSYVSISLIGYSQPCTTEPCPLYAVQSFTLGKAPASGGYFNWTVGKDINGYAIPSGQYLVQITDTTTNASDQSNAPFSIVDVVTGVPDLTITKLSVYRMDSLNVGIDYCIKNIGNADAGKFYLEFYNLDNPSWGFGGAGFDSLAVGKEFCSKSSRSGVGSSGGNGYVQGNNRIKVFVDARYEVKESNENNNELTYTFDTTLTSPSITVLSPNGGESWAVGSVQTIKWNSTGVGKISIWLCKSGVCGRFGNIPATGINNTGSYTFTVDTSVTPFGAYTPGSDLKIRVASEDNYPTSTVYDDSNAPFSIVAPSPDLVVTSFSVPSGTLGQVVNASATILNQGSASTGSGFRIEIDYSYPPDLPWDCSYASQGSANTDALAVGASRTVSIPLTLPSVRTGPFNAVIMADSDCAISESNEDNNFRSATYSVAYNSTLSPSFSGIANVLEAAKPLWWPTGF